MWIKMMEFYALNEKINFGLKNAEFKVYRLCVKQERNILHESQSLRDLNLNVDKYKDDFRTILLTQVKYLIVT